ncbi:restriction endonuclease subunit S [Streptomyces sp. NPDC006284]|uniref:restriction endonuclease subunit S n=1 Tax=Streptomyces sp. NPDC006284 TaxID=3156742 RepID=UPI0033BD56F3
METLLSVTADKGVIRQSESGRRDSSSADKSLYWDVHPGDVVYNTMRMWQGVSGVAKEGGIVSPAYTVCAPTELVSSEFLRYFLRESRLVARFLNRSQGLVSDTWNLRYKDFAQIAVDLPPLLEQQRIAEILGEVDLRSRIVRTEIAKERIRFNALRDSLVESGSSVEKVHFCDAVDFPSSQVSPLEEPYKSQILVAPDHVESGTGVLLEKRTAESQGAISGKYAFISGDVIFSKIRPYLRKVILADFAGICSADMYPLRPKNGLKSEYLVHLLLGQEFSRFVASVSMRTGIPKVNRMELADWMLEIPPISRQRKVADILRAHGGHLDFLNRELEKMVLLKFSIWEDLLSGEVRVPVAP